MELGKRLVPNHNFTLTIFAVTSPMSPAESDVIQSSMSPKLFDIFQLIPPVDISGLVDANTSIVTQLSVMMREARPAIHSAISALKTRPTVLIVNLFGTEYFPIVDELDMLKYVYTAELIPQGKHKIISNEEKGACMENALVLIAGAGPSGLAMAGCLTQR
jgi:coniferyl-alcohol glucosyltransferase